MALFIVSAAKPTLTRSRKLTKYSTITNGMMRHISLRETRVARSDFMISSREVMALRNTAASRAGGSGLWYWMPAAAVWFLAPASDEDGAEVVHIGQRRP